MDMGQPDEGPAASDSQQAPGGASQLVADTHSNLMKLQEMMGDKMPQEAEKLAQITQAFQSLVDSLGQGPGEEQPQGPMTTSPEVGAAKVQPAY